MNDLISCQRCGNEFTEDQTEDRDGQQLCFACSATVLKEKWESEAAEMVCQAEVERDHQMSEAARIRDAALVRATVDTETRMSALLEERKRDQESEQPRQEELMGNAAQQPDDRDPPSFDEDSRQIAEQTMSNADQQLDRINKKGCGSAVLLLALLSAAGIAAGIAS